MDNRNFQKYEVKCTNDIIKDQLTSSEKSIDKMSNSINSLPFFIVINIYFVIWIVLNICMPNAIDKYPFQFLSFIINVVSVEMALIIGLVQNRQDKKNKIANKNAYETNRQVNEMLNALNTKMDYLKKKIEER